MGEGKGVLVMTTHGDFESIRRTVSGGQRQGEGTIGSGLESPRRGQFVAAYPTVASFHPLSPEIGQGVVPKRERFVNKVTAPLRDSQGIGRSA
jgi:hypothetical protein